MAKSKGIIGTVKGRIKSRLGSGSPPVSPHVFPPALLKTAEQKAGYVALYIVAPREQQWPISFGLTTDPVATYHSFQKGWWEEHSLHVLQWTPGRTAAEKLKRAMMDALSGHRKFFSRGWYSVTVEEAHRVLLESAARERIPLFDDIEKQTRLYQSAQAAWEKQVGVQTERVSKAKNILPFLRGKDGRS